MPTTGTKQELYLAKNMSELNELTVLPDKFKASAPKLLQGSATRAYDEAEKFMKEGDEERSYVLFMKFFNIIKLIRTSSEYKNKKEFFDKCMGPTKVTNAITKAEKLCAILKERYDLKEAELVAKKLTERDLKEASEELEGKGVATNHVTDVENDKESNVAEPEQPFASGVIFPIQLYTLLTDDTSSLIVMDTRVRKDYTESHIKTHDIINVPSDIIKIGAMVKHIEVGLPTESRGIWDQRGAADYVILLDWMSHMSDVKPGTCLKTLTDAMYKFDTKVLLRSVPLVLDGGYKNWLLHYPSITTNPLQDLPTNGTDYQYTSPDSLLDFDYPDLLDTGILDTPSPNDVAKTHPPITTTNAIGNHVSVAQTDNITKPRPLFDRSKKPENGVDIRNLMLTDSQSDASSNSSATATVHVNNVKDSLDREKLTKREMEEYERIKSDTHRARLEHEARSQRLVKQRQEFAKINEQKRVNEEEIERMMRRKSEIEAEIEEVDKRRQDKLDLENLQEQKARKSELEKLRDERRKREEYDKKMEEEKRRLAELEKEADMARAMAAVRLAEEAAAAKREDEKRLEDLARRERELKEQRAAHEREKLENEHYEKLEQERKEKERERIKREKTERERVERERREREKVESDRKEKDKLDKERRERERLEREKLERLKLEKEKLEREKQKELEEELRKVSASKVTETTLPPGWEKIYDTKNERYYYRDHRNRKTQWDPPSQEVLHTDTTGSTYKTALKDDTDSGHSGLIRSHSSPDVSKLIDEPKATRSQIPLVNRISKPSLEQINPKPTVEQINAARNRDLNPVYGSLGRSLTGLRNLGNTCYMNSTIQCLNNCSPLVHYFLEDLYKAHINRQSSAGYRGEVVDEFAVVVKALWSGKYRSISSRDFKNVCSRHNGVFSTHEQQDSQEFLAFLLDALHEGLNDVRKKPLLPEQKNDNVPDTIAGGRAWENYKLLNKSIIVELFQGQLKSTLMCLTCRKKSVTFDTFQYLTLPLPSSTRCTLQDCMNQFTKEEKLSGSSRWKCPRCKVERDSVKKLDIWKLPNILIIHLNRFFFEGMWRQKLNTNVDFPVNDLDLNSVTTGPQNKPLYNLYAVTNHYGTMEGGHYTAYCKSPGTSNWHKFDDTEISDISKSTVKSSAAYFLFYTSIPLKPV